MGNLGSVPPTLGLRHVALNVQDPQASKRFYVDVFGMQVEWEPDSDNVYLTNGAFDNLAIHKGTEPSAVAGQRLDHIGFMVPEAQDVDAWYERLKKAGVKILRELKTHRDGARSCYVADPDGVVIQVIHHPPISDRAKR